MDEKPVTPKSRLMINDDGSFAPQMPAPAVQEMDFNTAQNLMRFANRMPPQPKPQAPVQPHKQATENQLNLMDPRFNPGAPQPVQQPTQTPSQPITFNSAEELENYMKGRMNVPLGQGPIEPNVPETPEEEQVPDNTPRFQYATEGSLESPNSAQYFRERQGSNPLTGFFRAPAMYVKLPSQGYYSRPGDIDFTVNGDVAVYPMTTSDEFVFRSPEALLNGAALEQVVQSCVPAIKNVRTLPSPDLDALLLAIRSASYGQQMDFEVKCPKCQHENAFGVNIPAILQSVEILDRSYVIELSSGLKVHLMPYTFDSAMQVSIVAFEENKLIQTITQEDVPDEEKIKVFNGAFKRVTDLNMRLITQAIRAVVLPNGQSVVDKDHIMEWLRNTSKKEYEAIEVKLKEINSTGIPRNMEVECQNAECKHHWTTDIAYDPSRFFD